MIEAHDEFYHLEIELANNRIAEIKEMLIKYEADKKANKKKEEEFVVDEEFINEELNADPEVIELRENIKHYESCLSSESHPILFGIRPEDFMEKNVASLIKNPSKEMKLEVSIAELLGNEYYAHIDFMGKDVIAKVNAELNIEKGQNLTLVFNLDKYSLFDKVNGKNIKPFKE